MSADLNALPLPHAAPDAIDHAVAEALATLRERGERITQARQAVIEALAERDDHPSADQVCERVQQRHSGVHRATVYRTLDTLTTLGVTTHVHVSGGATAYHLAAHEHAHGHLHARCRVCGTIVDLPAELLNPVVQRLRRENSFWLDPTHLALSGTCGDCHKSADQDL